MRNKLLKFSFPFLCLVFSATAGFAQIGKVLVQNQEGRDNSAGVRVKWYSQELIFSEGVNLYRREKGTGTWIKLNADPLKKKGAMPREAYKQDESLEVFVELVNEA